ncbi:MFS general substrate transporter [Microthyrium microscopicum]|uniref:MFS general substrate transporter n=1 Tax=Microthyrium microscopicum TaxID=703497 RepID=A0A6A6UAT7_9PEZI|nr:MFS general substrate transporter [Microthyrium microscopicum]
MKDFKGDLEVELHDNLSEVSWSEAEERAVRRKLDWHLVPPLTLMYLLCFIDRTNIGNAKIQGMSKDLDLSGLNYNYALTVFYIVYILVEIPSNMALKRLGANIWLPVLTVAFGGVCVGTAFVKTFTQLVVVRILLGITEGGMFPGTSFYLSCFYRREELLLRVGIFASSASMAGAFGGLLATGLTKIHSWGVPGSKLYMWRNIFFFEGLFTIFIGLMVPLMLPKSVESCKFFTDRERMIAITRLAKENDADDSHKVTKADIKAAIFNINIQFCAFGFLCANVAVQSLSLFMPTILNQMGYTPISAQLHSVPPYFLACCLAIFVAFLSDRTRQRGIFLVIFAAIAAIGYAVIMSTNNPKTKYAAIFIIAMGGFPNGPGFLSWGINSNAGSRAVASAYIMSVGTVGAVISTWTYMEKDKPGYKKGHAINLGFQIAVIALAGSCVLYCQWENKQRAAGRRDGRLVGLSDAEKRKLGYRHPDFRYIP